MNTDRYPTVDDPKKMRAWVSDLPTEPSKESILPHARTIAAFLHEDTPFRGLLLFHDLGSGKTCASIAAAQAAARPVIVLLPAALEDNFVNEVAKCGPEDLRIDRSWTRNMAPLAQPRVARNERSSGSELHKIARKHGAMWEPTESAASGSAFRDLSDTQQAQVREQLGARIRKRFRFVHYDGWSWDTFARMNPNAPGANPFDGHVIIIDEAHRVASMVSNQSEMARTVYETICAARGAKVVLLTATPISNAPCEIAALINMAKGATLVHHVQFDGGNGAKVLQTLKRRHPHVDHFEAAGGRIKVTFLPAGFERTGTRNVVARVAKRGARSDESEPELFERLLRDLEQHAGVRPDRRTVRVISELPLPDDQDTFNEKYIDGQGNVSDIESFRRAVAGSVSFVSNARNGTNDFPMLEKHLVRVAMSPAQYVEYVRVRASEIRRETRAATAPSGNGRKGATDDIGDYRVLSRASCNFVFPTDVLTNHPHDAAPKGGAIAGERAKVQRARMGALRNDHLRTLGRIAKISPKMALIADKVMRADGPCIVYSDFRTAEGAGAFAVALRALGHIEIRASRDAESFEVSDEDRDALRGGARGFVVLGAGADKRSDQLLLRAFNGEWTDLPPAAREFLQSIGKHNLHGEVVRTLIITSSSAQGINTRNVRQVHLMEPFWNFTRIDQVIGRAVRFRSHVDLPHAEQQVDAYTYVAAFTAAQITELPDSLKKDDRSKTSDELVLESAERKKKTIDQIYDILRSESIDCEIHNDATCA